MTAKPTIAPFRIGIPLAIGITLLRAARNPCRRAGQQGQGCVSVLVKDALQNRDWCGNVVFRLEPTAPRTLTADGVARTKSGNQIAPDGWETGPVKPFWQPALDADRQAVLGTVEVAQIWKSVLAGECTSAMHDYTTEKHGKRTNRENVLRAQLQIRTRPLD
jgi:hypothetical protein